MMQPELLQPSWPLNSYYQYNLDQIGVYGLNMDSYLGEDHNYSSAITTPEESPMISSESYFPTILPNDLSEFLNLDEEMQVIFPIENIAQEVERLEAISGTTIDDLLEWWNVSEAMENSSSHISMEHEDVWSSSPSTKSSKDSLIFPWITPSQALPQEDMETSGQTGLIHLLKAYGEAMEMGQMELAQVIVGCINEKVSPVGETIERVAFNLFQSVGNHGDYIKQESMKNFEAAFKAFYENFPYGRFAHFAANSAIFEAIPYDVGTVHIVDFDMGEGVQWPAMIEAIGQQKKALKLTSIKLMGQSNSAFEETRKRLFDYARAIGLKLQVEEITIADLVRQLEELKNREGEQEWLAFNCMVGLPHKGRRRTRSQVMEFLSVAKDVLLTNKGIIAFGDGEDEKRMRFCNGFSSFFDECLMHYQALCESMEGNFPEYLTEARIAMESLFLAPYISSLSWHKKWEENRVGSLSQEDLRLQGCRLSKESLVEAKEMVKERQSSYTIKVEGKNGHEMVLEWRGTSLVRVCAWK